MERQTDYVRDPLASQVGGDHYKGRVIQPIEYIAANNLDFMSANIIKYATRHPDKGRDQDVKKIIHYAKFLLKYTYGYTDEQLAEV